MIFRLASNFSPYTEISLAMALVGSIREQLLTLSWVLYFCSEGYIIMTTLIHR